MFKFINKVITGVFNMISRTTMKQVLRESPAITSTMVQKINEWNSMLSGNAYWCKDYVTSLKMSRGYAESLRMLSCRRWKLKSRMTSS